MARRGVVWLLRAQEPDGSWFGRWGANYVYGTGAVVPALIAAGVKPSKPAIRRAVAWLEEHQNPDGGWGEDLRSYDDPALAGRGESTASQTAWALLALLAAGEQGSAADRGAASAGWPGPSGPTAAGTSRSTPAPGSPATSTSTITCTGWPSPSAPWADTYPEEAHDRDDHLRADANRGARHPPRPAEGALTRPRSLRTGYGTTRAAAPGRGA